MNNIFTKIFVLALAIGGFAGTSHAQMQADALGNAPTAYSGYGAGYGQNSYPQSQYRQTTQNYSQNNNTAQIVSGVFSLFNAGTQAGLWGNRSSNSYGSYGNYGTSSRSNTWTSSYGTGYGSATSYGPWTSGSNMGSSVVGSNSCAYRDPVFGCLSN